MKKYIQIAILGSFWGILEAQLGTWLHLLLVPFTGAILMSFGLLFLVVGRNLTGLRGSCLLMALIPSFFKLLFVGAASAYPVTGILIQSALIELGFWHSRPSKFRYSIGGSLGVTYSLFHPFVTLGLLGGWTVVAVFAKLVTMGNSVLGLEHSGILIMVILILAHALIGAVAAQLAVGLVQSLEQRGMVSKTGAEPKIGLSE